MTATYDPKAIHVVIGGSLVSGYASDTFVRVKFNGNTMLQVVGCDGEVARIQSVDKTAFIELILMQTAPFNQLLQLYAQLDRLNGGGIFTASVKDTSGNIIHSTPHAWVMEVPEYAYGAKAGVRAWHLKCASLDQDQVDDVQQPFTPPQFSGFSNLA
jgi:hypothetical protein